MNPNELNQLLVSQIDSVLGYLFPNGKRQGRSFCIGSVSGEPGQSLRICLDGSRAGLWSDFSDDNQGGDLLALWQQSRDLSFPETLEEVRQHLGVQKTPQLYNPGKKKNSSVVQKPKCTKPSNEVLQWFKDRGIFEKSLSAYKVGQQGNTIVFPFFSPDGKLELVKYRNLEEEKKTGRKKIWSNQAPEYHLWGWHALSENDESVVICEGETDCLTWFEAGVPALSVPQGAGDGDKQLKWIENDFKRLERFRSIWISMDMDEPGQKAVQPIISRLGVERCKVVDLSPYKDSNEAHLSGELLKNYIDNARTQDPDELKRLADFHGEIVDEFKNADSIGVKLPWVKTHTGFRIRPCETTLVGGINGHGKTCALNHVLVGLVDQGEKVCVASMEMKPRKLGRQIYRQISAKSELSASELEKTKEFLGESVWMFEAYGTARASRILEVFGYARKRYGISHFVIDSLSKCGFDEDDFNSQKHFVDKLMEFAAEHNTHVFLVVHMRKQKDESTVPNKMDIKGTGALADMVSNILVWWRNKESEVQKANGRDVPIDSPDAILDVLKQRETGEEPSYALFFDKESCQFLNHPSDRPKNYINI